MLRYIIGGVALVATRYGLKKYLDKFEMRTSPSSKNAKQYQKWTTLIQMK